MVRTGGVAATAVEPLDEQDDDSNDTATSDTIEPTTERRCPGFVTSRVEDPCRTTVPSNVVTTTRSFADTHVPIGPSDRRNVSCTVRAIRTRR